MIKPFRWLDFGTLSPIILLFSPILVLWITDFNPGCKLTAFPVCLMWYQVTYGVLNGKFFISHGFIVKFLFLFLSRLSRRNFRQFIFFLTLDYAIFWCDWIGWAFTCFVEFQVNNFLVQRDLVMVGSRSAVIRGQVRSFCLSCWLLTFYWFMGLFDTYSPVVLIDSLSSSFIYPDLTSFSSGQRF